ncbi:MAG: hypothetical protein QM820_59650 [Minicystis sp.]
MTSTRSFTLLCLVPGFLVACGGDPCGGPDWNVGGSGVTHVTGTGGSGGWGPSWFTGLGEDIDFTTRVAADSEGHLVWAGTLRGTVDLCGEHAPEGAGNAFVTKLLPDGSPLWIKVFGGDGSRVEALSVAANDEIVIGGSFDGTLDAGNGKRVSKGADDAFVAKLDPGGDVVWVRAAGNSAAQQTVLAVAGDGAGNVAITGSFRGSVDWGTGPLTEKGGATMFVAKLDAQGAPLWADRFGGGEVTQGASIVVDTNGDVVVQGTSSGSLDFGGGAVTDPGGFLVKLDGASGDHVWSRALGDRSGGLALGAGNHYFLSGSGSGTAYFAKFDAGGQALFDTVFDVAPGTFPRWAPPAIDGAFAVLAFGVEGSVDLGGGAVGGHGESDIVIAAFDLDGGHRWSTSFASGYYNSGPTGVALTPDEGIFFAGLFEQSLDLGFAKLDAGVENTSAVLLFLEHR